MEKFLIAYLIDSSLHIFWVTKIEICEFRHLKRNTTYHSFDKNENY